MSIILWPLTRIFSLTDVSSCSDSSWRHSSRKRSPLWVAEGLQCPGQVRSGTGWRVSRWRHPWRNKTQKSRLRRRRLTFSPKRLCFPRWKDNLKKIMSTIVLFTLLDLKNNFRVKSCSIPGVLFYYLYRKIIIFYF